MGKLELKHIAPYLPYGLKCSLMGEHDEGTEFDDNPKPKVFIIDGASVGYVDVWSCKTMTDEWIYEEVFPILHPLSDLTKEIEVNGKWFVPLIELSKIAFHKIPTRCLSGNYVEMGHAYSFHFYNNNSDGVSFSCKRGYNGATWDYECYVPNQLELFQKLFEWHFDVFGLIKEGLAININTLEP